MGRQRRRPREAAGADVLAGRRRAADHVGTDRHARSAQEAAEPRHLSPAGDRAQQGDHALARASRRRARLPRPRARASGHAVSGRGRARRRSGDDARRGDAGARHAVRVPVRGAAARRADRDRQVPHARPAGARERGDRARGPSHARRHRTRRATRPRSKARSAITPATTTRSSAFPVLTIDRITMRRDPIYHSTYTGKPPDEPAVLGVALNEVFVPLLQKQFPEIVDFYLPPEGCTYRLAVVSMRKQYAGHAKRVMFGVWSFLRQFMYTKFIIVTDDDVDMRDWKEVDVGAHDARRSGARHADRARRRRSTTSTSRRRSPGSAARWASTRPTSGRARRAASGAARSRWTRR